MSMQKEITSLEELQSIISEEPAVLAYFYNDNCAPCISLRPKIIEMVDNNFPKMQLYFVNSDKRKISSNYAVYDNPTILIFFDRKEYIRASKYVSTAQLSDQIMRYYSMIFD